MLHSAAMNNSVGTMPKSPSLKDFRRIVVKVGSSLLVDSSAGGLKRELARIARGRYCRPA